MTERLACDLAAQGLVIISGMARGVDTAGHRGAISAKGKTVAVFGTALTSSTPKRTRASPNRFSHRGERSFPSFLWEPSLRRKTFRFATTS